MHKWRMKVTDSSKRLSFDVYNINEIQPKYPVCLTFLCIITDIVDYTHNIHTLAGNISICALTSKQERKHRQGRLFLPVPIYANNGRFLSKYIISEHYMLDIHKSDKSCQ